MADVSLKTRAFDFSRGLLAYEHLCLELVRSLLLARFEVTILPVVRRVSLLSGDE
jgi:hypothetical protein